MMASTDLLAALGLAMLVAIANSKSMSHPVYCVCCRSIMLLKDRQNILALMFALFHTVGCDAIFSNHIVMRECSDDRMACVQFKSIETGRIRKIWGTAEAGYWAVGESSPRDGRSVGGVVLHWDGHTWISDESAVVKQNSLYDLWGTDANNFWAVGESATILHWDGSQWEKLPVPAAGTTRLWSVFGVSNDNIMAVGENGLLLRWNGAKWTSEIPAIPGISLTGAIWRSVWATPGADYFVAGDKGYLIHQTPDSKWSGESITSPDPMVELRINAIFGIDSGAAWVVGSQGLLMEWSGTMWKAPQFFTDNGMKLNLNAIWTDGTGNIWTVGDLSGCPAVYRLAGGQLVRHEADYDRKSCGAASKTYRTVWGITGQEVWVGGAEDGTIQRRRVVP